MSEPIIGFCIQESSYESNVKILSDDGESVVSFETVLQSCDNGNRNNRVYPFGLMREAILSAPVQERLNTRTLYGEASHPFSTELSRQLTIDNNRVSHLITEITPPSKKGDLIKGQVETAATRSGKDMYGLITKNKSRVAFSMRGFGNIVKQRSTNLDEVTGKLALIGWDWVCFPSHKEAYMSLRESGQVSGITKTDLSQYLLNESGNLQYIIETLQIENPSITLSEDQTSAIVKGNQILVKSFLEQDLRREFRKVL